MDAAPEIDAEVDESPGAAPRGERSIHVESSGAPADTHDDALPPSKSQRKRDMTALQRLGARLVDLPPDQLDSLGLPEPLRDALGFARKVTSHEGRRRHMQYIGKLMRNVDPEPIQRALDDAGGSSRAAVARMHQAEAWRERLIADDAALTELVAEHTQLDVQQLRALVRAARRERTSNGPPRQTRALYKLLHDVLQEPA
jgi:ribosome-associated protein